MCWTSRRSACIPEDNGRLLETLRRLRDLGNTVIVVEHDEEAIRAADYVVDLGPARGARTAARLSPADRRRRCCARAAR